MNNAEFEKLTAPYPSILAAARVPVLNEPSEWDKVEIRVSVDHLGPAIEVVFPDHSVVISLSKTAASTLIFQLHRAILNSYKLVPYHAAYVAEVLADSEDESC